MTGTGLPNPAANAAPKEEAKEPQLFLGFLVDWEGDGSFIAIAAPTDEAEAREAVTGALRSHNPNVVGYVMPVTFVARGTANT